MDNEEKQLFIAAAAGDIAAFEAILSRYEHGIFSYIRRTVSEPRSAQDLTQETCIKLYRSVKKIDPEKNPRALIFKIATHVAYDFLRKQRSRPEAYARDETDGAFETISSGDPYALTEGLESAEELSRALEHIRPAYRSVLLLFYYEDMGYEEIGVALSIPINTVKTNIHRAKKELKKVIDDFRKHP